MLQLGVQTKNVVDDKCPDDGFAMLKRTGFSCVDFSLNGYLLNKDLYRSKVNHFFDPSIIELEQFFLPHKEAARKSGIRIYQMHMPYPMYVPTAASEVNEYLLNEVAPKSMQLCSFFECKYIVIHGFKLARYLGSEAKEWERTEQFINSIASVAKEMGITICIENLYDSVGGHLVEGPCCDVKKAIERIDRINDKYQAEVLGFCFDVGHANLVGINFEEFISALDYRLKVLHIHDNDGVKDLHQIPFTFSKTRENTSSTDWDGFLAGLRKIGYKGVLNFETAPVLTSFPQEMREDALAFIGRVGRYFSEQVERE